MSKLKYKGIVFDDFVRDEYGTWGEICKSCADKYSAVISSELDDGGTACGFCGVEGCENHSMDLTIPHYYIDFKEAGITWL